MELLRVGESLELLQASPEGRVSMRQPDLTSPHLTLLLFPDGLLRPKTPRKALCRHPLPPPPPHASMLR